MPTAALFGISLAFGVAAQGAVAWHYIWPALMKGQNPENLRPTLLLHEFRFLGLSFVVQGVVSSELPAAFAQPVAYGDFMTTVLALLKLATVRTRAGTADLLFAFYMGGRISTKPPAARPPALHSDLGALNTGLAAKR